MSAGETLKALGGSELHDSELFSINQILGTQLQNKNTSSDLN